MDKKCEFCGQMMYNVRSNKKYCSRSCGAKAERQRLSSGFNSKIKVCPHCKKTFEIVDNGYGRRYCYECVPQTLRTGSQVRQLMKQWALEYKGSKCSICGYDKCTQALEFHHLNMSEKEFSISDRNLICDWEIIQSELDKCILVCSNCHREIHAGVTDIKEG